MECYVLDGQLLMSWLRGQRGHLERQLVVPGAHRLPTARSMRPCFLRNGHGGYGVPAIHIPGPSNGCRTTLHYLRISIGHPLDGPGIYIYYIIYLP